MPNDLLTIKEFCDEFGFKLGTTYWLVHAKRIPHVRFGPRYVRLSRAQIVEWIESHFVQVDEGHEREKIQTRDERDSTQGRIAEGRGNS